MTVGTLNTIRVLAAVFGVVVLSGCPKRAPPPKIGPPRAYRLLADTAERETTQIEELRSDLEVDTREHERTPHVVAVGETPLLKLDGARARLAGDEGATKDWRVDNFILLEIVDDRGQILSRSAVGFVPDGVMFGRERLDNVGKMAFAFEAGEIDITSKLPETGSFKIRATALDYYGVGAVTDVFVVLDYGAKATTGDDDLRER